MIRRSVAARVLVAIGVLGFCVPMRAEDPKPGCQLCVGVVTDAGAAGAEVLPRLVRFPAGGLGEAAQGLSAASPEQRRLTTVIIDVRVEGDATLDVVEREIQSIVGALAPIGPFAAAGVVWSGIDVPLEGYAIKRLAALAQGRNLTEQIEIVWSDRIPALFDAGAGPYFDRVVAQAAEVPAALALLTERDPSKRIDALVTPATGNALYDAAAALAAGAASAYLEGAGPAVESAVARFDDNMRGDFAADPSADIAVLDRGGAKLAETAVAFVRGEDLGTVVVSAGSADAWRILSLSGDDYTKPVRVTADSTTPVSDTGRKDGRFLVGVPPSSGPFFYVLSRAQAASVTREAIDVTTQRGITVEEIIRNHQAWRAMQDAIAVRFIAKNTTKLRFSIASGSGTIEATLAGTYFSEPGGKSDWVLEELYFGGVRWKYGRFPELPILQPEKVSQLPLDIHLTNDYRYELVRTTRVRDYDVYEVRFEPPREAPPDLPLYRGTVWIDGRTWARVRVSMIQLNLEGEVLSNEEQIDFVPFSATSSTSLDAAQAQSLPPSSAIWLPVDVRAQQVLSIAGRAFPVERTTELTGIELDPANFAGRAASAAASDRRILRDTEQGLRYTDRLPDGTRVVKPEFDQSQLFLLGGVYHDEGTEYPVLPLGGIDYFSFDLWNRGIQTNVFFAGALAAVNLTQPSLAGTRTNLGVDMFVTAFAFDDSVYRDGVEIPEEAVKGRPFVLATRIGHPMFEFGKIDAYVVTSYLNYQQSDETASDYAVPSDTFVISPGAEVRYDRAGWSTSAFFEYAKRVDWEAWGHEGDYSPDHQDYTRFGATLGKSFHLPSFQRVGLGLRYLDGDDLDRFSKYDFGFFGGQRVRGIRSGSVRAEKAWIAELSYGFVLSDVIRLELYYDHALVDDSAAGYRRTPFQGAGFGGNLVGPWGTLLRMDVSKSVGPNRQDGFVANVVFLKLFG